MPLVKRKTGKRKEPRKKRKKICPRQGANPGPDQSNVRHLGFVHWVSFECFSRRFTTRTTETDASRQEEHREGERTRKKRKKFALDRERTRDLDSHVSAILDLCIGLVLGVFCVVLRTTERDASHPEEHGEGEKTKKKRKKICPRWGSNIEDKTPWLSCNAFIKHPV